MKISFKNFLLNENKYYLGNQVGDILTAVQELQQNSEGMGARQLLANSERILNQIRGILHSNWSKREEKYLKDIQKVGAAIARTIEEKDDLVELLPRISGELERISSSLGTPVNTIGTPSDEVDQGMDDKNQPNPSAGKEEPAKQSQPDQQQPEQPPQPEQQPQNNMNIGN